MNRKQNIADAFVEECSEVSRICKPLFSSTPIQFFSYLELHPNGEFYRFSNHHGHYREFVEKKLYEDIVPKLMKQIKYEGFFLDDLKPNESSHRVAFSSNISLFEKWGLGHECKYITQNNNKVYFYYFYSDIENELANSFYINNLTSLKYFTRYFQNEIKPISDILTPYSLDSEYVKTVKEFTKSLYPLEIDPPEFLLNFSEKHKITPRQRSIISWYMKGKTIEETAQILNLSKHTVDSHFERIRSKLNCHTKIQVVSELLKDFFQFNE